MWLVALVAACTPAPAARAPRAPVTEPPPPSAPSPLIVDLLAETEVPATEWWMSFDRPVDLTVTASDGEHLFEVTRSGASEHLVPLVGLYDTVWTFNGTVTDPATGAQWPLPERRWGPAAPPPVLPHLAVRQSDPERMSPGWTLFPITAPQVFGAILAVDAAGDIAWWYTPSEPRVLEARPTARGTLILHWDYREIREIDWLGRTVRSVTSRLAGPAQTTPVDVDQFHHELFEDAEGRWITLRSGVRAIPDFPASYADPALREDALVLVEPIVAIDPDDGAVLGEWAPDAVLDPGRIGFGSLGRIAGFYDWNHTNAVADAGDQWLVSLRHQDAVVAIDKADGALAWILSNPANWSAPFAALRLQGPPETTWPFHAHAVKWDAGRVLLFDNGNYRASPWQLQPAPLDDAAVSSRLVAYTVDPAAGTVAEAWSFDLDPPVFSDAMGDVDALPNGNTLGCWAHVLYEGGVANAALGRGEVSFRVVEVADDEVVWDLDGWGLPDEVAPSWHSYRAERVLPPR